MTSSIIRVVITGPSQRKGSGRSKFPYVIRDPGCRIGLTEGLAAAPLLDACRHLKSLGIASGAAVGLFDLDVYREQPRMVTTVGVGAKLTVRDSRSGPKFRKIEEVEPVE